LIGDKRTCPIDQFKKLLEQKFSILINPEQFDVLLAFLNQKEESEKSGEVAWGQLFKKYSEIE
jgi:hypothetical protein